MNIIKITSLSFLLLVLSCRQNIDDKEIIKEFLEAYNERDKVTLNRILSDDFHMNHLGTTLNKEEFFEKLSRYTFFNIRYSLVELEIQNSRIQTKEVMYSDLRKIMNDSTKHTKDYIVRDNKIVFINMPSTPNHRKFEEEYTKFLSWTIVNYPVEERELHSKMKARDSTYLDDIKFLYEKYKKGEIPPPEVVSD